MLNYLVKFVCQIVKSFLKVVKSLLHDRNEKDGDGDETSETKTAYPVYNPCDHYKACY